MDSSVQLFLAYLVEVVDVVEILVDLLLQKAVVDLELLGEVVE